MSFGASFVSLYEPTRRNEATVNPTSRQAICSAARQFETALLELDDLSAVFDRFLALCELPGFIDLAEPTECEPIEFVLDSIARRTEPESPPSVSALRLCHTAELGLTHGFAQLGPQLMACLYMPRHESGLIAAVGPDGFVGHWRFTIGMCCPGAEASITDIATLH